MISADLSAIFYLISGILFILALRGLSSPDTSRQGNYFGIMGMIIAIIPRRIIPPPIPITAEIDDVIKAEKIRMISCNNSKSIVYKVLKFYFIFLQMK